MLETQCQFDNLILIHQYVALRIVRVRNYYLGVLSVLLEWALVGAHSAGPIGASPNLTAWALNRQQ